MMIRKLSFIGLFVVQLMLIGECGANLDEE